MDISVRPNYHPCHLAWFVVLKLTQRRIFGVTPTDGRMPKRLLHSYEREKSSRVASRTSPSRRLVSAIDLKTMVGVQRRRRLNILFAGGS
jgi:hypothetical protein